MHIRFNELVDTVVKGRIAGKSFLEISRDCAIPDPEFIQLVYTWKVQQEPITWKQHQLELELARAESIHSAYWLDAISGDRRAASIILKANNSRMALIERLADFPEGRTDELSEMLIESAEEAKKVEATLRSQINKYNELIKDFEFPKD